jgi:predicted 3-demethylubiquinone-9 3-methyltransferase (glyoxalase superfamily)
MRKSWSRVGVMLVLATSFSVGCGYDIDYGHNVDQQQTSSDEKAAADDAKSAEILKWLKDNFGETTWGSAIERVEVHGDSVDVYTSIYPDAEGKAMAKQMAGAIFGNIRAEFFTPSQVTIWCQNDPAATHYDWQG